MLCFSCNIALFQRHLMLIGKLVIEIHPIGIVNRLLGLQLHLGMAADVCGKLALIGCVFALAAVHRDAH